MEAVGDWSIDDGVGDDDIEYHKFDKEVGELAFECLDALCEDIDALEADDYGWTDADLSGVDKLYEVDHLGRLLVPPSTTPLDNRKRYAELMIELHAALPFSVAEREWFLRDRPQKARYPSLGAPGTPEYIDLVRNSEVRLVSEGLYKVIRGRDLLNRWWAWRREVGEYGAGQGGLQQAREALKELTQLLRPDLGLPESYAAATE
jgi:hypothetical protein